MTGRTEIEMEAKAEGRGPRLASAATGRGSPSRRLNGATVQASPTQSCLVVPSRAFNFPGGPPIRVIREIRGRNLPIRAHSCAFVAALICAHLCASVAPTQYGLIRPNTALNSFAENAVCVSGYLTDTSERRVFGLIFRWVGERMTGYRGEKL
jgi:hypothetical protein